MPLCGPDGSALGNLVIVTNAAALPGAGVRYPGLRAYQADTLQTKEWDGAGWVTMSEPSQPWVPGFAGGVTLGNGSFSNSWYHRADGWIDFSTVFTLGSTSGIIGDVTLLLPIPVFTSPSGQMQGVLYDQSAGQYYPFISSNAAAPRIMATTASGTYTNAISLSSTVPFTWTQFDEIDLFGRFRMSSRYT